MVGAIFCTALTAGTFTCTTTRERDFEEKGALLMQTDGNPVHVGPIQGNARFRRAARSAGTTFAAADMDGDGQDRSGRG